MFLFLPFYRMIAAEAIGNEESFCFVFVGEFMLIEALAFMVRPPLVLGERGDARSRFGLP